MNIDLLIEQVSQAADSIGASINLANNETDKGILVAVLLWSIYETVYDLEEDPEAAMLIVQELAEQSQTLIHLGPSVLEDGGAE